MTINALRGRSSAGDTRPEAPAIGESDANIVDCPSCKRPLDASSRRCPGCGTRLIAGVQATKAGMFSIFGVAVGLLVGGSVVGVALSASRPAVVPGSSVQPSVVPSVTSAPLPTAVPGGGGTLPLVPVAATAALKGTASVNARITATAAPLAVQLNAPDFDSQAVAQILRRLNLEAGAAQALLPVLNSWDDAAPVHQQLIGFYESLRATANDALAASIRNDEAYRLAAAAVLEQVAALPAIDAASRDLARSAGVELPVLDTP